MTGESGSRSFEAAILPHLDAAHNLARWLMRNPDTAQDIVQEAAMRALAYFPRFRGVNPRAWFLQIVRNTAYTSMKRSRGLRLVSIDELADKDGEGQAVTELPDPGDDPEQSLIRGRDQELVGKMLERLPMELREVVILRELEELSYKEIAEITETPIGTVMSRLWRARQLLAASAQTELKQA